MKKRKLRNPTKLITVLFILFIVGFIYVSSFSKLVTVSYTIESDKISQNIKLAVIADLHGSLFGQNQQDLIKIIEEEKPDAILWVGDIIDEDFSIENSEILIKELSSFNNFFVSGNHDVVHDDYQVFLDKMISYDFTILSGETASIELNGQSVHISGIDDRRAVGLYDMLVQLGECANQISSENFSILMAHRPEYIDDYNDFDFDLVLSGHAHGGQWIIPGLINGVFAPGQGFFPEYAGGIYEFENLDFVVSRGLSINSPKVPRVFNPCEIVFININ